MWNFQWLHYLKVLMGEFGSFPTHQLVYCGWVECACIRRVCVPMHVHPAYEHCLHRVIFPYRCGWILLARERCLFLLCLRLRHQYHALFVHQLVRWRTRVICSILQSIYRASLSQGYSWGTKNWRTTESTSICCCGALTLVCTFVLLMIPSNWVNHCIRCREFPNEYTTQKVLVGIGDRWFCVIHWMQLVDDTSHCFRNGNGCRNNRPLDSDFRGTAPFVFSQMTTWVTSMTDCSTRFGSTID